MMECRRLIFGKESSKPYDVCTGREARCEAYFASVVTEVSTRFQTHVSYSWKAM